MEVKVRDNPAFDIPFFSVFVVDHVNWGREWEKERWEGLARKKVDTSQAIHDYQFMYNLQKSPNLQQTVWGREIALPYVTFGIQIAKHVESTFAK
jgi:Trm5-related predicted tRNA methylase